MDFKIILHSCCLLKRSAVRNICLCRLKVKVTLKGQMIKWSSTEAVRAITCTFIRCYDLNFDEVKGENLFGPVRLSLHLTPTPPIPQPTPPPKKKKKKKKKRFFFFFSDLDFLLIKITYSSPPPPPAYV